MGQILYLLICLLRQVQIIWMTESVLNELSGLAEPASPTELLSAASVIHNNFSLHWFLTLSPRSNCTTLTNYTELRATKWQSIRWRISNNNPILTLRLSFLRPEHDWLDEGTMGKYSQYQHGVIFSWGIMNLGCSHYDSVTVWSWEREAAF